MPEAGTPGSDLETIESEVVHWLPGGACDYFACDDYESLNAEAQIAGEKGEERVVVTVEAEVVRDE